MLRSLLAYGLLCCLALPQVKAWQHAFRGHVEIHCREDIPNHIHQAEFSCDFDKYHFSVAMQAPVLELGQARVRTYFKLPAAQRLIPEQASKRLFALRAPPV